MATQLHTTRLALRAPHVRGMPDGAWWPQSRRLSTELANLFALWPPGAGAISRVLYSPPDWDDHPHSVPVAGRWVKTGCFPRDDTHQLILSMREGQRLSVTVIPSDASSTVAAGLLDGVSAAAKAPAGGAGAPGCYPAWENEGGHL